MKTIAAITTPLMPSAIHIIRISGPKAFAVLGQITTKPIVKNPYTIMYNHIVDPRTQIIIDQVLLNLFVKPQSFTGEDTIEINCHGSVVTTQRILELLVVHGCEYAQPGEFSMQALMNNKLNYYQIEALNNFIHATSFTASQIALQAMQGKDVKLLEQLREQIFKITGSIEVNIDYPEYDDVPQYTHQEIKQLLTPIIKQLKVIYDQSCKVLPIFDGFKVAIIGKPNVGKSSLLNLLSKQDKAIVSDYQGTTRDVVETVISFNQLSIKLQDTAGMRETKDPLEQLGIEKTKQVIEQADLLIWLIDDTYDATDEVFAQLIKHRPHIKVQNKKELIKDSQADILISVKEHDINDLIMAMQHYLTTIVPDYEHNLVLQSHRQINLLHKIILVLEHLQVELLKLTPLDLLQTQFEQCIADFNLILGVNFEYNKLDELFKHFCLGK